MNFSKNSFTVDQFLALPVFKTTREAPVETPFLLQGRMSGQQAYISELKVDPGFEAVRKELQEQKKRGKNDYLKVQFWSKYKDGNIKDCGGNIRFDSDEKIQVKDDKIVFNLGDDVKFEHQENTNGL